MKKSAARERYELGRKGDRLTFLSITVCLIVILAAWLIKLSFLHAGLWLIGGGLVASATTNLVPRLILPHLARGRFWARVILEIFYWLVPLAIAAYVAGSVLLVIAGLVYLYSLW